MVLKGNNEIIVTCSCGCGNSISFKKDFDLIWVATLSSDFYVRQLPFSTGLRHIYRDLENRYRNKGRLFIAETIMKEQDVIDLIYALENLIEDMDDSRLDDGELEYLKDKSRSTLHMTNIVIDEDRKNPEWREYTLELESHLSLKDLLLHNHRQYDESYTRKEIEIFLKKARRMLKNEYNKNLELGTQILVDGMKFKDTVVLNFVEEKEGKRYFNCKKNEKEYLLTEEEVLTEEGLI